MRALTVLSVGYPLAAVSPDAAGGAEQVLAALDRGLTEAGHRSLVIAPAGSAVTGTLVPIEPREGPFDEAAMAAAQAETRGAIATVLARGGVDLVHLHGIDFATYLPAPGPPVLATLHLPPDWYPAAALQPVRPDTFVHAVSEAQHALCPASPALLPPIANGIPVERLQASHARRRFALVLGRICPEKGVHLAIAACAAAEMPLLIAGEVYAYPAHQRYFEAAIRPHLGPRCRFLGPVGFSRKRRLLSAATALLVPSLVPETSSLVAREAAACGTPVIAFPNGALADTVEDGRTGYLVPDLPGMTAALARPDRIERSVCRVVAAARFSDRTMIAAYLARYAALAGRGRA